MSSVSMQSARAPTPTMNQTTFIKTTELPDTSALPMRDESASNASAKQSDAAVNTVTLRELCACAKEEDWSDDHLRVLTRWKSQAFVHMYLQEKSNYYFRMIYNSLTFPVILLSAVSSATLFTSDAYTVKIFTAVVSILCACLAALQRQVRPAEQAAQHGTAAHRYQTLIHRIEACVNMVPAMRPEVRKFVEKTRTELEVLLSTQNEPPRLVISAFEKEYGRVEGILYGDEIADMIAQSLRAQAIYKRMENDQQTVSAAHIRQSLDLQCPAQQTRTNPSSVFRSAFPTRPNMVPPQFQPHPHPHQQSPYAQFQLASLSGHGGLTSPGQHPARRRPPWRTPGSTDAHAELQVARSNAMLQLDSLENNAMVSYLRGTDIRTSPVSDSSDRRTSDTSMHRTSPNEPKLHVIPEAAPAASESPDSIPHDCGEPTLRIVLSDSNPR